MPSITMNRIRSKKPGDLLFDVIVIAVCILIFFIVAYPIYFIIIASISDPTYVSTGQVLFAPKGFSFFGYEQIFADSRVWIGYRNTLFYAIVGTAVSLLLTLPAAYVLSRQEFRARRFLMFFFIFTMFFNGGLIPTYMLMRDLSLLDTPWVFIFNPVTVNIFNLIITRTFFENNIPHEMFEAATMDGCSHFKFFTSIVLPLSKAVTAVIGLYYLVHHWNDFFTGLIYIRDYSLQPLQIVLRDILLSNQVFAEGAGSGGTGGGYAQRYADQVKYGIIIVSSLPVLVLYPFIQKYFEKGVLIGSVKG
ncbi:carbohydrate ABC transporter permease [Gracilibacillus sp. S3-1-1]|uniref:Carbohydrate ABC transporter permease n=1 Tax=Gracilibacillus pellucidus TaxID=3095368 RepID=A0ACC6M2B2_9BACI|nr:carbohydrate ABC transporter permease [Gracilibacillus sp. S3-1-1]MDX8045103.1 carbohydrate ABC transporter permease [Gracilibacillus sp. S3-1-1]